MDEEGDIDIADASGVLGAELSGACIGDDIFTAVPGDVVVYAALKRCSRVDFPWKPPPTISVTPSGIPMPETGPRFGRSRVMRKDSGEVNGTA